MAGVQDDFFWPFVRGPDPDHRPVDVTLMNSEHRWGWQTPIDDEQQHRERASDEDKVAA
jgi:hypothetical protein